MTDSPDLPTISCRPNGSLLVQGHVSLIDYRGNHLETKPKFSLCRCGTSKKKPFCDGNHKRIAFDTSKKTDGSLDRQDDYAGKAVTIHDNRGICAHQGFCTDGLPAVWRMNTEPWINPDGASAEEIISTVRLCPSGALSHSIGGVEHRDQDGPAMIKVSKDGPLYVSGGVVLEDTPHGEGGIIGPLHPMPLWVVQEQTVLW